LKEYKANDIRNIAFIGHGGSGKTTISELLLFATGETNRIGTVEDGNTVSDFTANEIERKISILSTPLHFEWLNKKINLIDTPGYSDFTGQINASLHVVDFALAVVKSAEGIEVGTETAWDIAEHNDIAKGVIINKIDSEHSRFDEVFELIKDRLSPDAVIVTFPLNEGVAADTIIDVLRKKAFKYGDSTGKTIEEVEIPTELNAKVDKLHEELIEKIAESTEDLMNKFFEEGTLSDEDLQRGIKAALINKSFIPVFAMSALKSLGIKSFMDFIANYAPSPIECKKVQGKINDKDVEIYADENSKPIIQVFKSMSEKHVGELSIFKVVSGTLNAGMDLFNTKREKVERLGQLLVINGKNRKEVTNLHAGDIGAVVKLKDTHTSDTLATKDNLIILKEIVFPKPVIRGAIKPKAKGDEDKISSGLHIVHEEDPSLAVHHDPELSQTIVSGQGELQLALAIKLLKDRYNVDVELVEPKIPYRETIRSVNENAEYKHKKQSGGRGQYGHVVLKLEPLPRGTGFEFVDAIVGGAVPGRFIPAVEKGIKEVMEKGILTSSKVIDIRATLHFGSYHDVDSDEMSFKIAASQAFKKGFQEAKPVILEPIYDVTIKVPEEFMGDVMGDISSRRGKISGMDTEGPFQIIKAKVPLAELYKYSTQLRSLTSGRGIHLREFSHYEDVPKDVESKIIAVFQKEKEEEDK